MKYDDKLIGTIEKQLRVWKVISKNEKLDAFLRKPYNEIKPILDRFFLEQREWLKPVEGKHTNRLFFHALTLFSHSEALYSICVNYDDEIIKTNADLLRQEIAVQFIDEISPFIVSLFKWDLERRKWKNDAGKLAYLKRIVKELDDELSGKKEKLIKRYIWVLIDYFGDQMDKGLSLPDEAFSQVNMKKADVAKTRNLLKTISENVELNDFIDNEVEPAISNIYVPVAQQITEGIMKFTSRFDHVVAAFIQAQIEYKDLVAGILENVNETELNDIKSALQHGNITKFISLLQTIFASIPNNLIKKTSEAYYHVNIHVILKAIGCEIQSEVSTNLGRIDSVIEFDKMIYVIEYKITDSETAINQIIEKEYYQMYLGKGKAIRLIGIAFNKEKRNIQNEYSYQEITDII